MGSEGHRETRGFVVTNTHGEWLASHSRSTSWQKYIWVPSMRDAHVFETSLAARVAAFSYGGYVIELR